MKESAETVFQFENLRIYQETLIFIKGIYTVTNKFPKSELFGITNQLQRAAVSIALNIAEGSSRSKKDFRHFLSIARGSCYESAAILQIAQQRSYITQAEYESLFHHSATLARMLSSLRTSIRE